MGAAETLIGCESTLLVLGSMRLPKRLRLLGSAGGVYSFLVKGGEDLRNDERVQQLLGLMNSVVREGGVSGRGGGGAGLRARTYSVVPMTPSLGVLEWVPNTTPLKNVLSQELGRHEREQREMQNQREAQAQAGSYHKMFQKGTPEASQLYQQMVATLPPDLLRRRLLTWAPTPEALLTIRSEFGKTLAASSIFGYILGIGDRHLENILLDKSGAVVQIDFGVCFGIGTSVLAVPELIPFRLTPQLLGALGPLEGGGEKGGEGEKEGQEEGDGEQYGGVLCNALQVYLNDPVLDWVDRVTAVVDNSGGGGDVGAGSGSAGAGGGDITWEPRRRVAAAVGKLRGLGPALLLLDDLGQNGTVRKQKTLPALERIVWGAGRGQGAQGRGQGRVPVSVGQQADQLLSLATCPDVLVRQWEGLQTWL
ncbi:kinase-like domain-containing protein [Ochromonadaceae sp. CCMP2298]|nr:kinase-like domain-containing protein [Ochromonadaceae sp. CCMP2298]